MEYKEILESARTCIGPYCKACPVCNGKACGNQVPGPGAKAPGNGFTRNYDAWQKICVNMDTICPNEPVDTAVELFGTMYRYPFFAAPLGAMKMHYGDKYNDREYNSILVNACADSGIAAFTGDGVDAAVFQGAMEAIRAAGGVGVPTIKPWSQQLVFEKLDLARTSGCKAVAMDIDGAGLPFLKNLTPPAGSKSVQELTEIIRYAAMPFIVKGVMTVRGAQKAAEAGAAAIIVSNHGGRVLGQTPASAEVLAEIADAVGGSMKIFVDGGTRRDILINVVAFGFKYGIPIDADLVFDVRFLPNPFYVEKLRPLSGMDDEVREYVLRSDVAQRFLEKLTGMIDFLLPQYAAEGRYALTIGIGCTGGQHRSVAVAKALTDYLAARDANVRLRNRDFPRT